MNDMLSAITDVAADQKKKAENAMAKLNYKVDKTDQEVLESQPALLY